MVATHRSIYLFKSLHATDGGWLIRPWSKPSAVAALLLLALLGLRGIALLLHGDLGREVIGRNLAVELVAAREGHQHVDRHEVVVDRRDDSAEAGPDDARGRDGDLLRVADLVEGLVEVGDVGEADGPLEGRGPEVDRLGTRGVVPERRELGADCRHRAAPGGVGSRCCLSLPDAAADPLLPESNLMGAWERGRGDAVNRCNLQRRSLHSNRSMDTRTTRCAEEDHQLHNTPSLTRYPPEMRAAHHPNDTLPSFSPGHEGIPLNPRVLDGALKRLS